MSPAEICERIAAENAQRARIDHARQRFGRPFAHEIGTNWVPQATPVLTRWMAEREARKGAQ